MIVHVNNACANVHKVRIPLSVSGFIGMTMNFFSINNMSPFKRNQ